jgi:hypothetical protein
MNRRRKIYLSLGVIGVLWMLSPLLLHVPSSVSDAGFSLLVALGVCLLAFDDFEQEKTRSALLKVLTVAFVMFSAAAVALLISTGRGAVLIPLGVLGGGCLYWFIDKYVPANS